MEEKISVLMLKEHERLDKELRDVENSSDDIENLFNKFKWNLEKHFFIEEKAIFTMCNDMEGEIVSDIFDLIREHAEILNLVMEIEKIIQNTKPNFFILKKSLIKHRKAEDETFYPKLDESLTSFQKKELIERIKEIVRS